MADSGVPGLRRGGEAGLHTPSITSTHHFTLRPRLSEMRSGPGSRGILSGPGLRGRPQRRARRVGREGEWDGKGPGGGNKEAEGRRVGTWGHGRERRAEGETAGSRGTAPMAGRTESLPVSWGGGVYGRGGCVAKRYGNRDAAGGDAGPTAAPQPSIHIYLPSHPLAASQ